MKISNHELKKGNLLFKIAEISVNHNGSIDRANKTTKAAKQSRANAAVKLQTYIPDTININCDKEEFIKKLNSIVLAKSEIKSKRYIDFFINISYQISSCKNG
jgi:sialic acid synthase SpsE